MFLSSHLLSEVELISDRIAILVRGRVARLGKTSELLETGDQVEIVFRGVAPALFPQAVTENDVRKLTVASTVQRATIERMWAAGGEIVRVNPARRSLEDLFLELAERGEREPRA